MRQFIRHPLAIPIQVSHSDTETMLDTQNMGIGGLALVCNQSMNPGTLVQISIPYIEPQFATNARVVWCRDCANGTELGVEFLNSDDAYRTRMIEQICHIENYRKQQLKDHGRMLTAQEAALEWVNQFAAVFPNPEQD